jgi:sulfur relay (sulfurtransferase) DsrC/TusE family protein
MDNSSLPSAASKVIQTNNEDHEELVTITEKVNLTKSQYEVLNIICNTYEEYVSQYMQEALVEAMRFDIEEGNFSDVLLEKITDKKENNINKEKNGCSFLKRSSVDNDLDADLQF